MRRTVLPWESVPGPIYLAVDTLQSKAWVKKGGWVFVAALFIGATLTRWKTLYIFAVLYTFALVMKKYVAVTQRGLEIYHEMQITTNYERWDWADIYAVTHEPDPKASGRTILYFTKGDRTKRNYYLNDDAKEILKLARKQNPSIKIFDGKETRDQYKAIKNKKKK